MTRHSYPSGASYWECSDGRWHPLGPRGPTGSNFVTTGGVDFVTTGGANYVTTGGTSFVTTGEGHKMIRKLNKMLINLIDAIEKH